MESISDNGDKEVNFYFIPTLHVEHIGQKSLSVNKIPQAKNNWKILKLCKRPKFVEKVFGWSKP